MEFVEFDKIDEFISKHIKAKESIDTWKFNVKKAKWKSKQDVLKDFHTAEMISDNRAIMEIDDNAYYLVIRIYYEFRVIKVRFIGTLKEYDLINPETI
jgi:mRNA interferase HigB